jgi:oligogalacturonide lyase
MLQDGRMRATGYFYLPRMLPMNYYRFILLTSLIAFTFNLVHAQIGKRFPSERKVIKDPVTGTQLTFLTSTPSGDSKIYQTHNQWTSDGQWLIFRSNRVRGEAMAVNEQTGDIVQVTEGGYTGMLNIARKSMKLYFMRNAKDDTIPTTPGDTARRRVQRSVQIIEVNLEKLFLDSKAGKLKEAGSYQRVCGTTPKELGAGGDMALDGDEERVYFRVGLQEAAKHLPPDTKIEKNFGPRNMGSGPSGIASMNINTGEIKYVVSVPFQVGHIQTNPWVPGEIVFCWETGGKSPQRTWTVMSDGTGLRPLYPESEYEWVTHETFISKDEVAIAIMGHRKIPGIDKPVEPGTAVSGANPGQETAWGPSGTREKPTGLAIVNLRTRETIIAGQTKSGSGLWHVNGSSDGRWAVGDDFARNIYLIDRHTGEMILLSTGHKASAADHPHPTMNADGTKIQIQSAMLSADNRTMNICIIPVPEEWLKRKY